MGRICILLCWIFGLSFIPAALELEKAEGASYQRALLRLHNKERRKRNRPKLRLNSRLNRAAVKYAKVMNNNDHFSHIGPDGSTPAERVSDEGYNYSRTGENIALGYTSSRQVHNGWMRSSGHRRNILSRRYKHVGFGKSGRYWSANFGRPR